jgi:alpha-beta hydrolase superfamily lysophospholipase
MSDDAFTIRTADGVELHVHPFGTDGRPRSALLVLHGIMSHSGWYSWIGEELAARGVATFFMDRRGAGRSRGTRGHAASWRRLVGDVMLLSEAARARLPDASQHLLGISLGGTIALAATLQFPAAFESQVLLVPGLAAARRVPLRARLRLLRHGVMRPEMLYDLPFTVDQLTDRAESRAVYEADELRTRQVTSRFLVELFRMQRFVLGRLRRLRVPAYVMLAGNDAIVDNRVAELALGRVRTTSVRIEVFPDAFHSLTLYLPKDALVERLTGWLRDDAQRRHRALTRVVTTAPDGALPAW